MDRLSGIRGNVRGTLGGQRLTQAGQPLLQVRGLSKSFPGLKALDDVSLEVGSGEIVALVGQNGSGKSTLVKVLAGVHQPDPGAEIVLGESGDGEGRAGLHFIHQDLGLVGELSTIENFDLGRAARPQRADAGAGARRSAARRGAGRRLRRRASTCARRSTKLSAAERTIVAIARALDGWEHPRNVLVLDEPTAVAARRGGRQALRRGAAGGGARRRASSSSPTGSTR